MMAKEVVPMQISLLVIWVCDTLFCRQHQSVTIRLKVGLYSTVIPLLLHCYYTVNPL